MKTTRYFREQVLRKRPYLDPAWCSAVIAAPLRRDSQVGGRVRYYGKILDPRDYGKILDPRDGETRVLRIITLDDGETVHNAFFDRGYREDAP